MTDALVETWMEIVHLPRGRSGQGQPEWQPVVRALTSRGLRRTWPGPFLSSRAGALALARDACALYGLPLRSADIIPLRARGAA